MTNTIKVFTDGASRGNPGLAGLGVAVLSTEDRVIETYKKFIGKCTNNFAEYTALIEAVKLLKRIDYRFDDINFYLDSELVVKQITGSYKIKHKDLIALSLEFWKEIRSLNKKFSICHIPREENKLADKLANEAIDENNLIENKINN
ncbi:MAG: ribonuclease HI family protein [Ignavibacteria bacterium]